MISTRLGFAALAAVATLAASTARADYPDKNITFIVPWPAGGVTNLVGRTLAKAMEQPLGVSLTVVNRAGAAGTIGGAEMAKAAPDGYTIGLQSSTPLLLRPHTAKLPYTVDSYDYICKAYNNPLLMVVKKGSDVNSVEKMVAYGKANPGKIKYFIPSPGTLHDLANRAFTSKAGFKAVGVPLSGDQPAIQSLMNGTIQLAPLSAGPLLSNPDSLEAIAVLGDQRLPKLPNVPTMKEKGFDIAYDQWGVLVAPKGIPAAVKAKLESACKTAQATAEFRQTMEKFAMPVVYQSGAEFEKAFRKEFDDTGKVLAEMGLKVN